METALKVIMSLGIFFLILAVAGSGSTDSNPEAQTRTNENAFMSGCEETSSDMMTRAESTAYCRCALAALKDMYPDWDTNVDRWKRINTEGYTQAETDKFVTCLQ